MTALGDYLNFMAEPHVFAQMGDSVEIDLQELFRGFAESPSYSVTDGAATVSGSTATFTPVACGLHRFTVRVQDAVGSTMDKTVGVFADGC